eukprot:scaffold36973_cov54-Phaeocystis_antarctica.AAC.3
MTRAAKSNAGHTMRVEVRNGRREGVGAVAAQAARRGRGRLKAGGPGHTRSARRTCKSWS